MSFRRACRLLSTKEKQNNEEVKRFIENGKLCDAVDASKNTLLHHAAIAGNHEIAQYLVDSGSKVNARNDLGQTALLSTLETDSPCKQVIAVLLKAGASVFVKDNFGKSPFKIIESWVQLNDDMESFEIYKTFLENASRNTYYFDDFELLEYGTEKFVKMLLQTNIDLSATDSQGQTLVHLLVQNPNPGIMELLCGKKFDINARDSTGWTPLIYAVFCNALEAVKFLLEEGADIDAVDVDGETALYVACEEYLFDEKEKECVQILLEYGANAQIEIAHDDSRLTIFDSILEYENFSAGELVLANLAYQEKNGIVLTQLINSKIDSNSRFKAYFEICKQQLSMKVYRSVTLFDILTATERKFEHFLRDNELASKLKVLQTVDYFDKILRKRLSKAISIIELRKTVTPGVCEVIEIDYDSYPFIADDIVNYLDREDMECLISIFN